MFNPFNQFGGFGAQRSVDGVFTEQFRAFSAAFLPGKERESINYGSKIILPPSALARLSNLHIEYPMLFELSNPASAKATHGGVLEFIAEEGRAYLPRWMMQSLFLNEGDLITVKNVNLPLGKFVKIQPQSVDFLDIYDPRAVLEQSFRSYATLTKDDVISISYNNKQFDLLVMEVKPANAVSIVETDLEVDFAPPVGYKEPERQPSRAIGSSANSIKDSIISTLQATQGSLKTGWDAVGEGKKLSGRSLTNGKASSSQGLTEESPSKLLSTQAPLRLPLGQLFFGFDIKVYQSEEEKEKEKEKDEPKFTGEGQTLRSARKGKGGS